MKHLAGQCRTTDGSPPLYGGVIEDRQGLPRSQIYYPVERQSHSHQPEGDCKDILARIKTLVVSADDRVGSLFVQAVVNVGGSIPGEHLRLVNLMGALGHFVLFGSPFFRSRAVLWSESTSFRAKLTGRGTVEKSRSQTDAVSLS
jgi:hypothetical protein